MVAERKTKIEGDKARSRIVDGVMGLGRGDGILQKV